MDNPNRYAAYDQAKRVESAIEMADETLEHNEKVFALATAIVQQLSSKPEGKNGDDSGKLTAYYLAQTLVDVVGEGEGGQVGRIRECVAAMQEAANG
jgi:hypothetical protein